MMWNFDEVNNKFLNHAKKIRSELDVISKKGKSSVIAEHAEYFDNRLAEWWFHERLCDKAFLKSKKTLLKELIQMRDNPVISSVDLPIDESR